LISLYLILSLVTYIYILLCWIFRRRFSRCRIIRRRKCQQRQKGKARLSVPCPLSSISCRGGCYHPDLKSSKQVVHLQGDLLKVQIYQPFSRTGCVLPWQTNRIFVIDVKLRIRILFFSIAHIVHKVESHFKMRIPIDSALKLLL